MEIIQDVKEGRLQSAYAGGDFDAAKQALEDDGYRVISLEEQAGLRVQEGVDSDISRRGNWTREGFIYVPNKGAYLTKKSPVIDNAVEATSANMKRNLFYINNSQVESALADSVKFEDGEVPTGRLADDKRTAFAFGKNAKAYGEFLKEYGINALRIYLADSRDEPFATQSWL